MYNHYLGGSLLNGASYLQTRAVLNIQEGFNDGVSNHITSIGNFEVDSLQNSGFDNSAVNLSAVAIGNKLSNNSFAYNRTYKGQKTYYQDFLTQSSMYDINSETGSSLGISNSFLSMPVIDATGQVISINNLDIRDVSYTIKVKTDRWGGDNGTVIQPFIRYHKSNFPQGVATHFYIRQSNWGIRTSDTNNNLKNLAGGNLGITLANNTYYWFNFAVKGTEYKLSYSTTGAGVWNYIGGVLGVSYVIFDKNTESGKIGVNVLVNDTTLSNISVDSILINEIAPIQTRNSIIKSIVNGQELDYSSLNLITGFSPLWVGSTTSWNIGTSGSATFSNIAGGASYSYYQTIGNTFTDFTATTQVSNYNATDLVGMYFGTTNDNVGFYIQNQGIGSTLTIAWNETVGNNGSTFAIPCEYLKGSSTFYELGLVKQGKLFTALINRVAISSHFGLSIYNSNNNMDYDENFITASGSIGIKKYLGNSGSATFSNFKVSAFGELQHSINFDQGSNVQSAVDSLLMENEILVNTTNGVFLTKLGSSQGVHNIGLSGGYYTNQRTFDYTNSSYKSNFIKNDVLSSQSSLGISQVIFQADSSKSEFIYGRDNKTIGSAISTLEANRVSLQSTVDVSTISIAGRPSIEVNDSIIVVNDKLGISEPYTISTFNKTMDFSTSSFSQDLTLKKFVS